MGYITHPPRVTSSFAQDICALDLMYGCASLHFFINVKVSHTCIHTSVHRAINATCHYSYMNSFLHKSRARAHAE